MKIGTRKGFSLIEIGIVMVVIGLIIAAVMKGKDVIKGAEVKEVSQNFLSKWVSATDNFYDKLGFNVYGSVSNRMIYGTGGSDATNSVADTNGTESLPIIQVNATALTEFNRAGINLRKTIRTNTGNVVSNVLAGESTDDKTVTVHFGYQLIKENGTATPMFRNYVLFNNVPVDVAKAYGYHANSYLVKPINFEKFNQLMDDIGFYWLAWNHHPWGD